MGAIALGEKEQVDAPNESLDFGPGVSFCDRFNGPFRSPFNDPLIYPLVNPFINPFIDPSMVIGSINDNPPQTHLPRGWRFFGGEKLE